MRSAFRFVFATLALASGSEALPGDNKPSPEKQLQISLQMFEGDPLGSREEGTLRVVADPRLNVLPRQAFMFLTGGDVPVIGSGEVQFVHIGRKIEGKLGAVKDGRISVEITLSHTTREEAGERIQFHTESTRTNLSARLGDVVKLRWPKGTADNQTWVELTIAAK